MALFRSNSSDPSDEPTNSTSGIPEGDGNTGSFVADPYVPDHLDPHDYGVPFDDKKPIQEENLHPLLKDDRSLPILANLAGSEDGYNVRGVEFLNSVRSNGFGYAAEQFGAFEASKIRQQFADLGIDINVPPQAGLAIGVLHAGYRLHQGIKRGRFRLPTLPGRRSRSGISGGGSGGFGGGSYNPITQADGGNSGAGGYFNFTRLSTDPSPTEVRLMTPIKPNVFTPDYTDNETDWFQPLHVSSCKLRLSDGTTSGNMYSFIKNSAMYDLVNITQRNISYSINSNYTVDNLITWLNNLLYALQIYYSLTALLAYGDNPLNKNSGLLYLRGLITSSVGDEYLRLKRTLQGTAIPPNLNSLAFWYSQIYTSSSLPTSAVNMILPFGWSAGNPTILTNISTAITNLTSTVNTDIGATLGRAIPNWYATPLIYSVSNPMHDPNFRTVWANTPYVGYSGTGTVFQPYGNESTSLVYASYSDNLDGAAFALTSYYTTSTGGDVYPGMVIPVSGTDSSGATVSRLSYNGTSFIHPFGITQTKLAYLANRGETYNTYSSSIDGAPAIGPYAERCYYVNGKVIAETTRQLVDWMLSWDTIPAPSYNNLNLKGAGSSGKRRRRRRPKSK